MRVFAVAVALVATTALAAAQPQGEPPAPAPATAREVADAPRPDKARNLERDDRSWTRHLLWGPRALLFVPKWTLWVAMAPVRGSLWAYDRLGVGARITRWLSGDGPVSAYPLAKLESGFSLTYGVSVAVRDAFGKGERFRLKFLFGGEVEQIYGGKLESGHLLGDRVELELDVELQLLQNSRFFGIGNGDLEELEMAAVDPRADDTAVLTRFDQDIIRAELGADVAITDVLQGRFSTALIQRSFEPPSDGDAVPIADVYQADGLVGYTENVNHAYAEASLTFDNRDQPHPFVSTAVPSRGWKLDGFAGLALGFEDDPSSYLRYGIDIQRYIDLYRSDRVLILRAQVESVTADIDEIPFVDLPSLGGSRLLRGYNRGRFRDRWLTAVSVEHKYPINRVLAAFVFVDAGSVYRDLDAFDVGELRLGYGGGIQLHTQELFLMRTQVAYGDDGVIVNFSFNPSANLKRRTRRK